MMDDEQLAADYLGRLEAAAASLPAAERDSLVAQAAARIAQARATGPQRGTALAAVHLQGLLESMGDPADLGQPSRDRRRSRPQPAGRPAASQRGAASGHEITAVVLLVAGGFLAGIGWLVGVVLLWTSPRWKISDKLLGTLIWPGGVAGALAAPAVLFLRQVSTGPTCLHSATGSANTQIADRPCPTAAPSLALPGWLIVTLILVSIAVAIGGSSWMAARLLRRARESRPGTVPAAPDHLYSGSGAA
jgi:hypothetical protein